MEALGGISLAFGTDAAVVVTQLQVNHILAPEEQDLVMNRVLNRDHRCLACRLPVGRTVAHLFCRPAAHLFHNAIGGVLY